MSELLNNLKNLREISGAGFLDCKKALEENKNDINKSIDYLRKKGLSQALKKSSRKANEGAVGFFTSQNKSLLIEINTETDFVAKNIIFLDFIEKIANFFLNSNFTKEIINNELMDTEFENKKLSEHFTNIIQKIGENIVLKRIKFFTQEPNTNVFSYTHNAYRKNIGKISVALKAEIDSLNEEISNFGKNLCMHIAASQPISLDIHTLDKQLIKKESEIHLENIKSSGKPNNVIEKILEGKMKKYFSEVTLYNQYYIIDNDKTVKEVIDELNSMKERFKIIEYSIFILGA